VFSVPKCILSVIVCALLAPACVFARDLPKEFQDHRSLVPISDADQASVQTLFDEIFEKIKIPGDPEKPPQIVLMRSEFAAAFVYPMQPGYVFVNVDFFLGVPNVDVLAAVYAHELTHFEQAQVRRGGTDQGRFLNEVEAETRGVVDRVTRLNQIDPATRQPQAAPYSLEAIIEYYEGSGQYSSTHPNAAHIALGLKAVFGIERYRRTFPPSSPVRGLSVSQKLRLLGAALITPAILKPSAGRNLVRENVQAVVNDLSTSPWERIRAAHARIKKVYDPKGGKAEPPNERQLEKLAPLYEEVWRQATVLGQMAGASPESHYRDLRKMRPGTFSDLAALKKFFPKAKDNYAQGSLENLGTMEKYFEHPEGATISNDELYHLSWGGDLTKWLAESSYGFYFRVLAERNEAKLIAAFEKDPWTHLEAMTSAARYPAVKVSRALHESLSKFGREMSADEAIEALAEKRITPDNLVYLEYEEKAMVHRLPLNVRKRIADYFEEEYQRTGDIHLARLQARIFNGEPEELRQRLAKLAPHADPFQIIGLLYHAQETLPNAEVVALFAPHLEVALRREAEKNLITEPELSRRTERENEMIRMLKTSLPKGVREVVARHVVNHAPHLMGNYKHNYNGSGLPWDLIFPLASAEQIANHFHPLAKISLNNEYLAYGNEAAKAMTAKARAGQASERELLGFLKSLTTFLGVSTPELEKYIEAVEERLAKTGSESNMELLRLAPANAFASPAHYLDFVHRQIGAEARRRGADLPDVDRQERLKHLRSDVETAAFKRLDPLLQKQVLTRMAMVTQATPAERDLFRLDLREHEDQVAHAAVYLNEILDVYDDLNADQKLLLIEWLRGQRANLTSEILSRVAQVLYQKQRYVLLEDLEAYLRSRFEALPPMARGTFFQIALDGPNGFLKAKGWRSYFEKQLFANLPKEIRSTVQELFSSGLKALPPALRNLAFSLAYAESGKHGSPEQALRLFFSRMGPLMKKLGQNLAFDPHLPESYRLELRKLWDENELPDWWHVYDLVERQHGKIWEHGYKIVAIRNAGSTEIMVEIVGPDGVHEIISVQREALLVGNETDRQDLERYVKALTKTWDGRRKYGFLELLVEDAARTMKQEADPTHKRKMNEEMRAAYQRAVERIGGSVHEGRATLDGWNYQSVDYHQRKLGTEGTFTTIGIAPGVPLKELAGNDPKLYHALSHTLLRLENEAQQDPTAPIDKDRMPGQVFVDVATKTVTLLDPGQASLLDPLARAARDAFVGASLAANTQGVHAALEPLGIPLSWWQRQKLALHLLPISPELRPLQTLHWLRQQRAIPMGAEGRFWDLVHGVRAKLRLAQWGQDISSPLLHEEWTSLAKEHTGASSVAVEICRRVMHATGLFR